VRTDLGNSIENLAAVEEPASPLGADPQCENSGLMKRPGKKDHPVPCIRVKCSDSYGLKGRTRLAKT
jgi:hypothetical protein